MISDRILINTVIQFTSSNKDKIIQLGYNNKNYTLPLLDFGYQSLYLINKSNSVYNLNFYTKIKYLYGFPGDTHFPDSLFSIVILPIPRKVENLEIIFKEAVRICGNGGKIILILENVKQVKQKDLIDRVLRQSLVGTDSYLEEKDGLLLVTLNKSGKESSGNYVPSEMDIISYSSGRGGISAYCDTLSKRLFQEYGIKMNLIEKTKDSKCGLVILEYHNLLPKAGNIVEDVRYLSNLGKRVIIECHSIMGMESDILSEVERRAMICYRSNENAEYDGCVKYSLLPLISYNHVYPTESKKSKGIILGSFGYPFEHKRIEDLILLSNKQRIKLNLFLSVNDETQSNKIVTSSILVELKKSNSTYVDITTDYLPDKELADRLSCCSHLVFANKGGMDSSGTMQFAKRIGKPIVAIDSYQSRQAQVSRVNYFTGRLHSMKEEAKTAAMNLMQHKRRKQPLLKFLSELTLFVRAVAGIIVSLPVNVSFFENLRDVPRDEDGLDYLITLIRNINDTYPR